jgi:hypothetical protein
MKRKAIMKKEDKERGTKRIDNESETEIILQYKRGKQKENKHESGRT